MAKTLTKLDGSVVPMTRGKPKKTYRLLEDGNYQEVEIGVENGVTATNNQPDGDTEQPPQANS